MSATPTPLHFGAPPTAPLLSGATASQTPLRQATPAQPRPPLHRGTPPQGTPQPLAVEPLPQPPVPFVKLAGMAAGTTFADFKVLRLLAKGGMGVVYEAEQLSTGRRRALKVMHRSQKSDERMRKRFVQEARVGSLIESEHVVDVVVAGVDDATGAFWIAMELLQGETLAERFARAGAAPMPSEDSWLILAQLCRGLVKAHHQGVVHRDLKPANIFLCDTARDGAPYMVKILDFGIARFLDAEQSGRAGTLAMGTPMWMSPEQARGGEVSPAADVWSVGLLAFRLFSGRTYWFAANQPELNVTSMIAELLQLPIASASERADALGCIGRLPMGFDPWFARCVARDPAQRFADAREMAAALAEIAPASVASLIAEYAGRAERVSTAPTAVRVSTGRSGARGGAAESHHDDDGPPRVARDPSRTSSRSPAARATSPAKGAPSAEVPYLDAPPERSASLRAYSGVYGPAARGAPSNPYELGASNDAPAHEARGSEAETVPLGLQVVSYAPPRAPEAAPELPAPRVRDAAPPQRSRAATIGTAVVAFLLGGAAVFALRYVESPAAPTAVRRARSPEAPMPPEAPSATETPAEPTGGTLAAVSPPNWVAGAERVWTGASSSDATQLSFTLTLRLAENGRVTGHFAWSVVRGPAHVGEQVREVLDGTYEPTLGTLDVHGTMSSNPSVLAVNAYRLRVLPGGGVAGDSFDGVAHLTGAAPPREGAAPR